jgi:eukaryotic-like serine/threonine-protein kinase
MALAQGTRLGIYEILQPLGAGGMGEVYAARDTRLGRNVAIKLLRPEFADDPQQLARIRREAMTLASVTHPNVAVIHGLEETDHDRFLVLELVPGQTLAERLKRGSMKVDEALAIARQIVDALDAAHDRGIVHRDLKPANIKVAGDGRVKVLDFGIAKPATEPDDPSVGASETISIFDADGRALTVVGTPAYMSPEQARGQRVDKRTDIWAFGCVLYEMLTARRAFAGEGTTEILASVLEREPDFTVLPHATPPPLRVLLHRCLQKDPARRMRDIADARFDLEDAARAPAAAPASGRSPSPRWTWLAIGTAAAGLLVVGYSTLASRSAAPATVDAMRFTIPAPENGGFAANVVPQFAVSPDGRALAFVAAGQGGQRVLWLRPLDTLDSRPLPGTEGATYPFWSPDGKLIGFFARGKLKKIPATGGPAIELANVSLAQGGTWSKNDVILFAPTATSGLHRVSAAGGPAMPLPPPRMTGEVRQRWPQFLPDGVSFIVNQADAGTWIGSLDSNATRQLTQVAAVAYANGYLFTWRDGVLMAHPFDAASQQLHGDGTPVAEHVAYNEPVRYVPVSVSQTGVLVYAQGDPGRPTTEVTWKDRTGRVIGTIGGPAEHTNLSLSPDERRVAISVFSGGAPVNRDIWLFDVAQGTRTRFTFDPSDDAIPIWSPDGARIVFASMRPHVWDLYQKSTRVAAPEELLVSSNDSKYPMDWSRDGRFILYSVDSLRNGTDLWVLPLTGDRRPFPVVHSPFDENYGTFAPDGRWIAYSSNESGQEEVYVEPFPATGGKVQISNGGGTQTMWRGDGRELFFVAPDGSLMAAPIKTTNGFESGAPQRLFATGLPMTPSRRQYAVTGDGTRFLINVLRSPASPLTVVVNWPAALRKRD